MTKAAVVAGLTPFMSAVGVVFFAKILFTYNVSSADDPPPPVPSLGVFVIVVLQQEAIMKYIKTRLVLNVVRIEKKTLSFD